MELKEKEVKVLELFLTRPEICRRHLTRLFPEMPRSSKYQILRDLTLKELLEMHPLASATFYTLTERGEEELSAMLSTKDNPACQPIN